MSSAQNKFTVDFHFRALEAYMKVLNAFHTFRKIHKYRDIEIWNIHLDAGITEDELYDWCKATGRHTVDDLIQTLDID